MSLFYTTLNRTLTRGLRTARPELLSFHRTNVLFSTTTQPQTAKDPRDQDPDDRTAINIDRAEYTRSGTDSEVAAHHSSFDRTFKTVEEVRAESERETQRDGKGKPDPLECSPANRDFSQFTDEFGRGEWVEHHASRRVSPRKGKRVDYSGAEITEESETKRISIGGPGEGSKA